MNNFMCVVCFSDSDVGHNSHLGKADLGSESSTSEDNSSSSESDSDSDSLAEQKSKITTNPVKKVREVINTHYIHHHLMTKAWVRVGY